MVIAISSSQTLPDRRNAINADLYSLGSSTGLYVRRVSRLARDGEGAAMCNLVASVHMRRSDVTRHYSMKACRLARLCLHCRFESNNTFRVSRSLDDVKCIVVTRGLYV